MQLSKIIFRSSSSARALGFMVALVLGFSALPAQAATETIACSTSGTFTIIDNVVTKSDLCTGAVVIPEGVATIYDDAFAGATGLTSVSFPQTLTLIGMRAFQETSALEAIEIPNSVVEIQSSAFQFSGLTSITIPSSVVTLGSKVFYGSATLTDIFVDSANQSFSSTDGVLTNKAGSTLIHYPEGNLRTTYAVPESVLSIGDSAFTGASRLTEVSFSDQSALTSIGNNAFQNATALGTLNIPPTLSSLGTYAFSNASSLLAITIPAAVTSIGSNTFKSATSLASVIFAPGSQLTSIGTSAFNGTSSLASISLPPGLTSIATNAFQNATALTSIVIPSGVTTLGDYAFYGATQLASVSLPESLQLIRQYSFAGATALTSINIPAAVTGIGAYAFDGATALTNVTFSENSALTTFGIYAFRGATSLTSIQIPAGVVSISASAFNGTSNLATVFFASNAPTVGPAAFTGVKAGAQAQITADATGFTAGGTTWNSLTIAPAKVSCYTSGSIAITINVVTANNSCVGSVTLPVTITAINDGVLSGAPQITSIIISFSSTLFGFTSGVLFNKTRSHLVAYPAGGPLTTYALPLTVASVAPGAFANAVNLATITVTAGNTNFVAENGVLFSADKSTLVAYPAASANTSYAVPAEVTTIAAGAFAGARNLTSLTFVGDAPTVGANAFVGVAQGATANVAPNAVGFGSASTWNGLLIDPPVAPAEDPSVAEEPVVINEVPASVPTYGLTPPATVVTHPLESVAPIFPRFKARLAKNSKLLIGVDSRRSSATVAKNSQGFIMNATISEASQPFCTITKARKIIGGVVRVSGFKVTAKNGKSGICRVTLYAAASQTHKASQKTFAVRVSAKG